MTSVRRVALGAGYTLALGGGGARGYAHIGVAEALAERGLRPGRIVGTSMGAVIGAGLAAGLTAEQMVSMSLQVRPWREAHRPARLAMFDHRPLLERVVREVGNPRIEELPIPFGAAAADLVTGEHRLITSGPILDALVRSCAISVVFVPIIDGPAILADAGLWEPVPVSLARAWSPAPVVGVRVIGDKPGLFERGPMAWSIRVGARWLGTGPAGTDDEDGAPLGARRYAGLLAEAITRPVIRAEPDLRIVPNLWGISWIRFGDVDTPRRRGYEAARKVLAGVDVLDAIPEAEATPAAPVAETVEA